MRFLNLLFLLLTLTFIACDDDDQDNFTAPPNSIQSYLDNNYPNAEIEETDRETLCTGESVYEVEIEVNDDDEIYLTFDTEGNLLFTETEIDYDQLPAAVRDAISSEYGAFSTDDIERLDLANGEKQYEVELESSEQDLEVLFAADGTVICEQEDDD